MKRTKFLMVILLLIQSFWVQSQNPGDSLFNNSYVHDIHINFYEPNFWDTLNVNYNMIHDTAGLPTGEKRYLPAQIIIDGNTLDTVGIRQKGYFSNWGAVSDKKPLKVDINEFVSGQKYDGLKKFNLNNGFEDPSMMRELVALDLMRTAGIKVPRVAYANVYLNGTHWGLYILMEQVDKTFLNQNFSNGNGNLYKAIGNTELIWQGGIDTAYLDELELKTNETANDWSGFMNFLKVINKVGYDPADYLDSLNAVFNVDDYLKVLAIDVLIYNWDSYYDHGRNFYIYHNPDDDKFHWIPWDYNLSFADLPTDIIFQNPAPFTPKPLINNILAENSLKDQYFDAYCQALSYNFTNARIDPIIDSVRVLIEPHHQASTNEFFTTNEMVQNLTSSVASPWGFSFPGLKSMITSRTTEVNNELSQLNYTCITNFIAAGDVVINEFMAHNDSTTGIADQDGEYDDWIELYNNTNNDIDLTGYYLSDDFGNIAQWTIPDTIIAANGYLVIWADKDDHQDGLHADFKLSKSGEEIRLSAPNSVVIDSVMFGAQQAPSSYARLPNGTGSFSFTQPTFGAFNAPVSTDDLEKPSDLDVNIYPNPAQDELTIELYKETSLDMLQIVSVTGQLMIEKSLSNIQNKVNLNVSTLPSGMYLVIIQTNDNQTITKKLMIAN